MKRVRLRCGASAPAPAAACGAPSWSQADAWRSHQSCLSARVSSPLPALAETKPNAAVCFRRGAFSVHGVPKPTARFLSLCRLVTLLSVWGSLHLPDLVPPHTAPLAQAACLSSARRRATSRNAPTPRSSNRERRRAPGPSPLRASDSSLRCQQEGRAISPDDRPHC